MFLLVFFQDFHTYMLPPHFWNDQKSFYTTRFSQFSHNYIVSHRMMCTFSSGWVHILPFLPFFLAHILPDLERHFSYIHVLLVRQKRKKNGKKRKRDSGCEEEEYVVIATPKTQKEWEKERKTERKPKCVHSPSPFFHAICFARSSDFWVHFGFFYTLDFEKEELFSKIWRIIELKKWKWWKYLLFSIEIFIKKFEDKKIIV